MRSTTRRWTTAVAAALVVAISLGTWFVLRNGSEDEEANVTTSTSDWSRVLDGRIADFPPVVAGDSLLVITVSSPQYALHSLDRLSGRVRWTRSLDSAALPVVAGDLALLLERNRLVAMNIADGEIRWNIDIGFPTHGQPPLIQDERIYIGSSGGNLASFRLRDGGVEWRKRLDIRADFLTIEHDSLYVDGNGRSADTEGEAHLYALDARTGRERWRAPLDEQGQVRWRTDVGVNEEGTSVLSARGGFQAPETVRLGNLVITGGRDLTAIVAETGEVRWRAPIPGWG